MFGTEIEQRYITVETVGTSTAFEEADMIMSVGEVIRRTIFSEDESSEDSYWTDHGQSPFSSDKSSR